MKIICELRSEELNEGTSPYGLLMKDDHRTFPVAKRKPEKNSRQDFSAGGGWRVTGEG